MSGNQGPPASSPRRTARAATRRRNANTTTTTPTTPAPTPETTADAGRGCVLPKANKTGRPRLTDGWQADFLAVYRANGAKLALAGQAVGVDAHTVRAERQRDETFSLACAQISEEWADTLETKMETQAETTGNPVGYIVRLKALRPALYLERHLAMSITATAEIPSSDARQLLAHALGAMLDSTTQRVLPVASEPRELDASKDASKPSLS